MLPYGRYKQKFSFRTVLLLTKASVSRTNALKLVKATRPGLGTALSAVRRASLERVRHEQIWGIWLSRGEGSEQTAGTEKKLLRVLRSLAGWQMKMPTSPLSFLLLFLPVNWTFPHSIYSPSEKKWKPMAKGSPFQCSNSRFFYCSPLAQLPGEAF